MMIDVNLPDILPLPMLYAEIHYRFRGFPFSRYYQEMPEVIFDAPRRIEPGQPLPVYLIIKDADRFPVELKRVRITVRQRKRYAEQVFLLNTPLNDSMWHKAFHLDVRRVPDGWMDVHVSATFRMGNKLINIITDNLPTRTYNPLYTFKATEPLPSIPGWHAGELHCHTEFGCDQVEFGAPLEIYRDAAQAMGLKWVALTDHSYNLDDYADNYLVDDPDLGKWHAFLDKVDRLNKAPGDVILLPGEELSCRSTRGRNIHLLMIGQRKLLPGSGDSAQKWLRTRSELSIAEAVNQADKSAVIIAAHPLDKVSLLEKLLINRGKWEVNDLHQPDIPGWQIANGLWRAGFEAGYRLWIESLLNGERKYIYAGNDAHGNLNRYAQVKFPMLTLAENHNHLFGQVTSCIKADAPLSEKKILDALREGRVTISDGPAMELTVTQGDREFHTGDTVPQGGEATIRLSYMSSPEFGEIRNIKLLTCHNASEEEIDPASVEEHIHRNGLGGTVRIRLEGQKYVRAELTTYLQNRTGYRAYTNPVWLEQDN